MAAILTYKGLQPALFSFEATPKGSCFFCQIFLFKKLLQIRHTLDTGTWYIIFASKKNPKTPKPQNS